MSLPFVTSSTVVNEGANRGILAEIKEPAQRSREAGARGRVDQAKMTVLILRTIGIKDCAVIDNGHPIGRIRYAAERTNEVWMWNFTGAVPGGGHRTSPSLEEAKAALVQITDIRIRGGHFGGHLAKWNDG